MACRETKQHKMTLVIRQIVLTRFGRKSSHWFGYEGHPGEWMAITIVIFYHHRIWVCSMSPLKHPKLSRSYFTKIQTNPENRIIQIWVFSNFPQQIGCIYIPSLKKQTTTYNDQKTPLTDRTCRFTEVRICNNGASTSLSPVTAWWIPPVFFLRMVGGRNVKKQRHWGLQHEKWGGPFLK